jgi:hydroxyacylglutathione hydrolase
MTIEIRTRTLGSVQTNCYIVGDTHTGNAIVIDPVDDAAAILAAAAPWTIRLIVATHSHFDHVLASADLKQRTGAPFYVHALDLPLLQALPMQGRMFGMPRFADPAVPDRLLQGDGEVLNMDGIQLETLFTPGHAPGHVAYYLRAQGVVFSGDCLFKRSIGRTDLPGGDHDQLIDSIRTKLFPLGDDVRVLSGHGQPTTIGQERRTNPFLQA